jgi:intracellular septation protein A
VKWPVLLGWVVTLVMNIGLPILTYDLLADHTGEVPALLISGVWPVVELVINLLRTRSIDEFSMFVLIFLALSVISLVAFNSPRVLFIKDSAVTGLFGLVLLGSLTFGKPLMFYFGRRFAAQGIPAKVEWWNGLWQYPQFRRGQRILTLVWGLAFLAEAVTRIVLTYRLSVSSMVVVTNVLPIVVLAVLIAGTTWYGKVAGARGQARTAAAAQAEAAPAGLD